METGELTIRVREYWKKYRWAGLILVLGLILVFLPEGKAPSEEAPVLPAAETEDLQQQLEELLSRMEGAGKVRVLLSQAAGSEHHYQTDLDSQETMEASDRRVETVIITGSDRGQQGLVRRVDPPKYLGAVVLCQGADRPAVRLAVVDAVGTATGLTSDKISVLKMK